MNNKKLCLALDGLPMTEALALLSQLRDRSYAVKVHDLYDDEGPSVVPHLRAHGAGRVWVDYKLHDTKDTVGYRVAALRENGVDIVTVHASGGLLMMREAVKAAGPRMEVWAITALTSLDDEEIKYIYGAERTRRQVVRDLARMANDAGVGGLVCSAQEVGMLYQDPEFVRLKLVVPGTRSVGVDLGQQKRSGTPGQAMADGATYLVAGSQVTKANDPRAAFDAMEAEISG